MNWKQQNDLIFSQPSNLRFLRGVQSLHQPAFEVCPPPTHKHGHTMDLVVIFAVALALITAPLCFS